MKFLRDDWRYVWRFWSLHAVTALMAWNMLPVSINDIIPPVYNLAVSVLLYLSYLIALYLKQPKLDEKINNEGNDNV